MAFGMSPFPFGFKTRQGGGDFTPHFWVDSTNGDDGNDGASAEAAFATLGAAETAALAHGNGVKIGIVAGTSSSRREMRGKLDLSSLSGVQVRGVGVTDALPVIRGDDVIDGPWDDSTDRADAHTAVYSQSYSWESDVSNGCLLAFWDMGRRLTYVTSVANCQSTAGSWYMATAGSQTSSSPQTLYIHPFNSTNPNSDGKTYEGIKRIFGVRLGDNSQCHLVWTMRAGHNNGGLFQGRYSLAERALSSDSVRHQALLESGTMRRVVGWSPASDTRTGQIHLEFYYNIVTGLSGTWDTCIAVSDYNDKMDSGFGLHSNGSTYYERITLKDSLAARSNIGGTDLNNLTVQNTRLIDGLFQTAVNGNGSAAIDNLYHSVEQLIAAGTHISVLLQSARPYVFNGLRLIAAFDSPSVEIRQIMLQTAANNVTINNSIIVDAITNPAGVKYAIWAGDGTVALALANSIIDVSGASNTDGKETRVRKNNSSIAYTGENNVFWPGGVDDLVFQFVGVATYNGAPAFLTAVQPANETGSLVEDPDLGDPINGDWSASTSNGAGDLDTVTYLEEPPSIAAAEAWVIGLEAITGAEEAPALSAGSVSNAGGSGGTYSSPTFANGTVGSIALYPRVSFSGSLTDGKRVHIRIEFDDAEHINAVRAGSGSGPALRRWGNVFADIVTPTGSNLLIISDGSLFSVDIVSLSIKAVTEV